MNQRPLKRRNKHQVSHCQFPGCSKEIKPGARMCTRHWLVFHNQKKKVCNQGKTEAELIEILREKEKGGVSR